MLRNICLLLVPGLVWIVPLTLNAQTSDPVGKPVGDPIGEPALVNRLVSRLANPSAEDRCWPAVTPKLSVGWH